MGHFPQDGENEQNLSEQLRKLKKIKPFGDSEASKTIKFRQILLIFPVLGKMTHMWYVEIV